MKFLIKNPIEIEDWPSHNKYKGLFKYMVLSGVLASTYFLYEENYGQVGQNGKGIVEEMTYPIFSPDEFRDFTIQEVVNVSPDTKIYRFTIPDGYFNMTVAGFLLAKLEGENGKQIVRPYTPITLEGEDYAKFEVLVKTYPKGEFTQLLAKKGLGDIVQFKGPNLKFPYVANEFQHIGFIAGGTGITPAYQVLKKSLGDPHDNTRFTLIFANNTEQDILLKKELNKMAEKFPNRLKIYNTLVTPPKDWKEGTGFVSAETIKTLLPPPSEDKVKIMVCGPPGMMNAVCGPKGENYTQGPLAGILKDLGYDENKSFSRYLFQKAIKGTSLQPSHMAKFLTPYRTGILSISVVVLFWTCSSFLLQRVLSVFPSPFFSTYISISSFQLYLVGMLIQKIRSGKKVVNSSENFSQETVMTDLEKNTSGSIVVRHESELSISGRKPYGVRKTILFSAYFCIVYFLANYFSNLAFANTHVDTATILMSTSSFFTLLLGVLFKQEKLTFAKVIAVFICVGGIIILGKNEFSHSNNSLLGNIAALASAFLYGCYSVLMKKLIPDEDKLDTFLFFGSVGAIVMFCFWPVFFVLNATKFEVFVLPTLEQFGWLTLNNIMCTFLGSYLWYVAMLYTTPVVTAVALSLMTPAALVGDILNKSETPSGSKVASACLVMVAFLIVNLPSIDSFCFRLLSPCFPCLKKPDGNSFEEIEAVSKDGPTDNKDQGRNTPESVGDDVTIIEQDTIKI